MQEPRERRRKRRRRAARRLRETKDRRWQGEDMHVLCIGSVCVCVGTGVLCYINIHKHVRVCVHNMPAVLTNTGI